MSLSMRACLEADVEGFSSIKLNGVADKVVIGRGNNAGYRVKHPEMSGLHCTIFLKRGKLYVKDNSSTNGTFVDGEQISSDAHVELHRGAMVTMIVSNVFERDQNYMEPGYEVPIFHVNETPLPRRSLRLSAEKGTLPPPKSLKRTISETAAPQDKRPKRLSITEVDLICPITQELMKDPVVTSDGQTYERNAIQRWLQWHITSPITNNPLKNKELTPNTIVRGWCRKLIEQLPQSSV